MRTKQIFTATAAIFALALLIRELVLLQTVPDPFIPITKPQLFHTNSTFRFLLIGDFGWIRNNIDYFPTLPERLVLSSMNTWASLHPIDLIFSSGDNFYPQVNSSFDKDAHKSLSLFSEQKFLKDLPLFLTYGNHDCYAPFRFGQEMELLYKNVFMPEPPFNYSVKIGQYLIDFSFLSCDLFCLGPLDEHMVRQCRAMKTEKQKKIEEYEWLEKHLRAIRDDKRVLWRIVFVHFPIFSVSASSGDSEGQKIYLLPVMERFGVDLVVSGHNHNMEHLVLKKGVKYARQEYKDECKRITHLTCKDGRKPLCWNKEVKCEGGESCEDRSVFEGFTERWPFGKVANWTQGEVHQVVQGAGGGILDPLCNTTSPMAELVFALADFGFSEVYVDEMRLGVKYIHANSSKVVFENNIFVNGFE